MLCVARTQVDNADDTYALGPALLAALPQRAMPERLSALEAAGLKRAWEQVCCLFAM